MPQARKDRIHAGQAAPASEQNRPKITLESPWLALGLILLVGIGLRLKYLWQPIRYDEAVTYLYFVRDSWGELLRDYRYPNNHVFHTLLVKLSVELLGNQPWVLRIPAFTAGVLTIPAAWHVGRLLHGARVGLLGAALVATSGALILYSTNARGYSLVIFATLVLVIIALRARETSSLRLWGAFAIVSALGLWSVPTMLYPLGGVTVWVAWHGWRRSADQPLATRIRQLLPVGLAATVALILTGILYAPIVLASGFQVLVANKFVQSSPMEEFFAALGAGAVNTTELFSLGYTLPLFLGLLAIGTWGSFIRTPEERRESPHLLLALLAWSGALLLLMHKFPFPRVWLFLLPAVLIWCAAGLVRLLDRRALAARSYQLVAAGLVIVFGGMTVGTNAVPESRETGTLPDAEALVSTLQEYLKAGDKILALIPANAPLQYWMDKRGVDLTYLTRDPNTASRYFFVINTGEGEDVNQILTNYGVADTSVFARPYKVAELPQATLVSFAWKHPR